MSTISIDDTLHYTKDLTLLYAEDDLELQARTKEFFQELFKSVKVVDNGKEALQVYEKEHFDIVVSDVKMPFMDGKELTTKIKMINPHQCIIIISAYDDAECLLKFINLNIHQFLQKPIKVDNMMESLYYASKSIVNEKMVQEYRQTLEQKNRQLNTKGKELQTLVRILDVKLAQIAKDTEIVPDPNTTISKKHLEELQEIEIDMSGALVLIHLSKKLSIANIEVLASMLLSYALILEQEEACASLYKSIKKLSEALTSTPESFIKRVDAILILLESFTYILRMWRNNIVNSEIQKAFELHISMIDDIETILTIIGDKEND